jgi:hypothetical protein
VKEGAAYLPGIIGLYTPTYQHLFSLLFITSVALHVSTFPRLSSALHVLLLYVHETKRLKVTIKQLASFITFNYR